MKQEYLPLKRNNVLRGEGDYVGFCFKNHLLQSCGSGVTGYVIFDPFWMKWEGKTIGICLKKHILFSDVAEYFFLNIRAANF